MSTHRVTVERIASVSTHPNADRLDIVTVNGWNCVTQKGTFKEGDLCIYIPIDSILPPAVEEKLFGADAKVKLSKSRVKTIKLRGAVSQGMAVKVSELFPGPKQPGPGTPDLAKALGITKYQPPVKVCKVGQPHKKRDHNPYFHKYTDIENIKNYTEVLKEGEIVWVTEKIHGTNFRAGWVPFVPRTWWHKVKGWFNANPEWEFVYGSRNLQLQDKPNAKTYYDTNVYAATVAMYSLKERIPRGYVVYGEVYGPSIQKGYHYGLKGGETALAPFDVMRTDKDHKYLPPDIAHVSLKSWGLTPVPVLYAGPYQATLVKAITSGDSVLAPTQKIREGVVVRPVDERMGICGRVVLKSINEDYLLSKHADEETVHE